MTTSADDSHKSNYYDITDSVFIGTVTYQVTFFIIYLITAENCLKNEIKTVYNAKNLFIPKYLIEQISDR